MIRSEYSRAWYHANRERVMARRKELLLRPENRVKRDTYMQKYVERNREALETRKQSWSQRRFSDLKTEVIAAYGGRCVCCGVDEPRLLTIDHSNRDGKEHRKQLGRKNVYQFLKEQGWPQDGYRLLCISCNWVTRYGEPCPHVEQDAWVFAAPPCGVAEATLEIVNA